LNLGTVVLAFPLLSGSADDGSRWVEGYSEREAAESAVEEFGRLDGPDEVERHVALFLLASDLAELGLFELAADTYHRAGQWPLLAGAAFLGELRALDDAEQHERLHRRAPRGPWEELDGEERAEALFRAARAAFATSRYPEARDWLREIPQGSSWYPFSRYLLAQTEFALGRYDRAIEAAEPIFAGGGADPVAARLRQRMALVLGEMMIEIGLYETAKVLLELPGPDGPVGRRAQRDRSIASALAAAERGDLEQAERIVAEVVAAFERAAEQVGADGAPETLAERLRDLRRTWPPRERLAERRRWAEERARSAIRRARESVPARIRSVLWANLPPVVLWRLLAEARPAPLPGPIVLDEATQRFFAPRGDISRALVALALLEESSSGASCARRAAARLRARAAAVLIGRAPAPGFSDLATIAASCDADRDPELEAAVTDAALRALAAETRAADLRLRQQRYLLEEAIARARFVRSRPTREEPRG
jgi:tetratricopeptide (TPR) repeat protein